MSARRTLLVLDTNVILHDSACLHQFHGHDVVIPITVLEELDHFKKGNDTLNFHARQFVRMLDELSGQRLFDGGVPIGANLGRVMVHLEREMHPHLAMNFPQPTPDHRILNIAYHLHHRDRDHDVILVSKDVNLRMKAKSVGLTAQDYQNDQVRDLRALYTGFRFLEEVPDPLVADLFRGEHALPVSALALDPAPKPNEFFIVRNRRKSALAYHDATTGLLRRIDKTAAYGVHSRNAGQAFALASLLNDEIRLVSISGKAGTGKTLLSLAAALEQVKRYVQIYVTRPVVPLSNRDIGYLPGNIRAKLIPYMQPLYDNLGLIQSRFRDNDKRAKRITTLLHEERLKIEPLSYIRGRSLGRVFFIVDEAQNLTPHEVKTIITRAGEDTKIVFTGDVFQIDHPYLDTHANGLSYVIERLQGQSLYAHINLERGERSQLAELASNLL